jgi:Ca-activated chloride channel family protein
MRLPRISVVIESLVLCACLSGVGLKGQQPQQAPAPAPAAGEPDQGASIRQNVNLVDVLFTVFNNKNKIVSNLEQADFKVFDDNLPQEIRFFSRQTDLPLRVGLLLDTSNSIRERLKFEQQAATDFLFDVIRRDKDQAFLMTVDDNPEVIQPFTGDVPHLRDVIQHQRAGGGTALYDAIYQACQELLRSPPPAAGAAPDLRRVMVVISDGEDNLSRHSRGEALDMAQRAGIVIYAISTSIDWIVTDQETNASKSFNRKYQKNEGDRVLEEFSTDSGGRVFFPYHVDDLAQSFQDIGEELRSQYSLGYVPAGRTADRRFHSIRITVNTKGLQVHARKGYYALPDAAAPVSAVPSKSPRS